MLIINSDDFIVRMCYKSKLVDSDHENFTKLCQILQTSIEHNSIEVFYRNFEKFGLAKSKYILNVDKYTSRLLLRKLGDIIKVEVSNISINIKEDGPKSVSERELASLQYIGDYIVRKLNNIFRNHQIGGT